MISLKKYTKEQILTEGSNRFKKIASMLDKEDREDMLQQALSWLDMTVFYPRILLVEKNQVIEYKGGWFVDVTNQKIDVINNVYYEDTFKDGLNPIVPELGIMPFLLGGNYISLTSVFDYLNLRSNINGMMRQLELDGDYELFPPDPEGRRLLQVKKPEMLRIEFLPSIDRDAEEWYLYDFEYAALKDVLFDMCNLFNAEMTMSAQALGVGKESENMANYWKSKLEADEKAFTDKSLVTYIA